MKENYNFRYKTVVWRVKSATRFSRVMSSAKQTFLMNISEI